MNILSRCTPVLVTLLVLVACADNGSQTAPDKQQDTQAVQQVEVGGLDRIHSVGNLYIASQPSGSDFEKLKEKGVVAVINLRPDRETPEVNDQKRVEGLGMTYINVPLAGPDQANESFFNKVREQLRSVERPVLLHCSSANRAGTAWLTYRVLDEGVPVDRALEEARQVGMRSQALEDRALEYIRNNQ